MPARKRKLNEAAAQRAPRLSTVFEDGTPRTPSKNTSSTPRRAAQTPNKRSGHNGLNNGLDDQRNFAKTPRMPRRVLVVTPMKEDGMGHEHTLERLNLDEEEDDELAEGQGEPSAPVNRAVPETPTRRGRGRPRQTKQRTPTPPLELAPSENFFNQTRNRPKTSDHTLPPNFLLTNDEFSAHLQSYIEPHAEGRDRLHALHSKSFDAIDLALESNINVCLFGLGSKLELVRDFAAHRYDRQLKRNQDPRVIQIPGYSPVLTRRYILTIILGTLLPDGSKLPASPEDLQNLLDSTLEEMPPTGPITLLVHSIDGISLRNDASQALLAHLASHKHISLVASADGPEFGSMWDIEVYEKLRLSFRDCTTWKSFARVEVDAVAIANKLLRRNVGQIRSIDGTESVLRALQPHYRNLFRLLVEQQIDNLAKLDKVRAKSAVDSSIARTDLYPVAVENFVCSSEKDFATLLREFVDHGMIQESFDAFGAKRLWVPFAPDDLEKLLKTVHELGCDM